MGELQEMQTCDLAGRKAMRKWEGARCQGLCGHWMLGFPAAQTGDDQPGVTSWTGWAVETVGWLRSRWFERSFIKGVVWFHVARRVCRKRQ